MLQIHIRHMSLSDIQEGLQKCSLKFRLFQPFTFAQVKLGQEKLLNFITYFLCTFVTFL